MAQTQAEIYKDTSIAEADIANNAVSTAKIQDGATTRSKLANAVKPAPFTTRGFNDPV